MAKVPFSKLGLSKDIPVTIIHVNGQDIEVKSTIPIEDKLALISDVINLSIDSNNYYNPEKIRLFTELSIVEYYTNVSFTEKQKENIFKVYDLLNFNGVIRQVMGVIPAEELNTLKDSINSTVASIYAYHNSVLGILDAAAQDYSNLEMDIDSLKKSMADNENLGLLKDVLNKLG